MKSSSGNSGEHLTARERYEITPSEWNGRTEIGINRHRTAIRRPIDIQGRISDHDGLASVQRKCLSDRRSVTRNPGQGDKPPAVRSERVNGANRLWQHLLQTSPIQANPVDQTGSSCYAALPRGLAEKDFVVAHEPGGPAHNIRNLPSWHAPIHWRDPDLWLTVGVRRLHDHLLAIG